MGARVLVRAAAPDGCNINDQCGATHPDALAHAVAAGGFEMGLAFDGDGDRLIAVDHTCAVVDGDHIIAICALDLHRRGLLRHGTVVVTVMSAALIRVDSPNAGMLKRIDYAHLIAMAAFLGGLALGGSAMSTAPL